MECDKTGEEFTIFAQRYMHFLNLLTVYNDFLSGHYVPSGIRKPESDPYPRVVESLMLQLYAYFYSLTDHRKDGVNAFRVWRARFPEEENAIAAVEACIAPFQGLLRQFRNRLGFHCSRSMEHEAPGFDLFANHSGTEIMDAMLKFRMLGATLFAKDVERQRVTYIDAALLVGAEMLSR